MNTVITEQSAGGVVIAQHSSKNFIALVQHADGTWVLPKGHVDQGEITAEAAVREVEEETALSRDELEIVRYLGKFPFNEHEPQRHALKENHFYLMRLTRQGDLPDLCTDPAHVRAAWHALPLSRLRMRYAYQRQLLESLLS